jgi:hypothetical protein
MKRSWPPKFSKKKESRCESSTLFTIKPIDERPLSRPAGMRAIVTAGKPQYRWRPRKRRRPCGHFHFRFDCQGRRQ